MSITLINELIVSNVDVSIKFYTELFDFKIKLVDGNPISQAQLEKDGVVLMLQDYDEVRKEIENIPQKVSSCNMIRFEFDDMAEIRPIYSASIKNAVEIFMDYIETDYGKAEFGIYDPDKNIIVVSAPVGS